MSRNKTIKLVHDLTGKPFAECRTLCKSMSWNEDLIYMALAGGELQRLADALEPIVVTVAEYLAECAEACANLARGCAEYFDSLTDGLRQGAES